MGFEVKEISSKEVWDNFINKLTPHTFLQTWEWGLAQESLGCEIFRLGLFQNNKLKGVAFIYKIKARRGSFLFCPHGPLLNYNEPGLFKALINYLKELGKKQGVDFVRISPLINNSAKSLKIFKELGFHKAPIHMHPELAWILDITLSEEELLKNMKKRTRYSIKKAKKDGVKIVKSSNSDDIDTFYELYKQTAVRQDFIPFSKEYIKKEFNIFAAEDKALVFFADYHNELISTAIIIFSNGSGFYHHGASMRKYSNITASELLQWEAILEARDRGMKLYNFWGIAPENAKNHPWVGLSRFKKGFNGFSEAYLSAQDLILTPKYLINYIIEKIRKIKRRY